MQNRCPFSVMFQPKLFMQQKKTTKTTTIAAQKSIGWNRRMCGVLCGVMCRTEEKKKSLIPLCMFGRCFAPRNIHCGIKPTMILCYMTKYRTAHTMQRRNRWILWRIDITFGPKFLVALRFSFFFLFVFSWNMKRWSGQITWLYLFCCVISCIASFLFCPHDKSIWFP